MAALEAHTGRRGVPGFTVSLGATAQREVVPAMVLVDSLGNEVPGGANAASAPFSKPATVGSIGGGNPTYRAVGTGYAAYATPSDLLVISGSATKTVIVTALNIAPGATAASLATLFWLKRSTANTGGTASNPAAIPVDSGDPAATAVISLYTAAPTTGTLVGNVGAVAASITAVSGAPLFYGLTGSTINGVTPSPSGLVDIRKPIILRGVAESLALNFNAAALPAGFTATWSVEWVEV